MDWRIHKANSSLRSYFFIYVHSIKLPGAVPMKSKHMSMVLKQGWSMCNGEQGYTALNHAVTIIHKLVPF